MKKRIITFGIGILAGAAVLAGCSAAESGTGESTETVTTTQAQSTLAANAVTVRINTRGVGGIITFAEKGEELKFDEEVPIQSAFTNVAKGTEITIAAKSTEEGYKFKRWTKDGEIFSKDEQVSVIAEEDVEYIAEFGPMGSDETHVDLEKVKTIGEVMGLPSESNSCSDKKFVYVFEQDDNYYRAMADCTPETFDAVSALDFNDANYDEKLREIVSGLEVSAIENLTEAIPTQEELDKLIGKTGDELIKEGWTDGGGQNLEDMIFYMEHGVFSFEVAFDGELENKENVSFESIKPLVVKSIKYTGLGDAANPDVALSV